MVEVKDDNGAGHKGKLWFGLLVLVLSIPSGVYAQSYTAGDGASYHSLTPVTAPVGRDTQYGVDLGDFVLHPGLAVEGGYDTNVFFEEELEGVEGAMVLHVMPSLRLETPEPRGVKLTTGLQLLWELYPSDQDHISAQSGVDLLGDLAVQFGPRGVASVTLYDVLRNYSQSPTAPANNTTGHLYNEIGLSVALHPGGAERTSRRGFTGSLTAGYGIEVWDDGLDLNRSLLLTSLEVKYYFLPKTALRVRGSYSSVSYDTRTRGFDVGLEDEIGLEDAFADTLVNIDSAPMVATFGIAGLLTKAIDFGLDGGYSVGGYGEGQSWQDWVASANVGVFFTPRAHLGIGWQHDFADSSFGNYYALDRFYGQLSIDAGDWIIAGSGGYENRTFATVTSPFLEIGGQFFSLYSTEQRVDPMITADFHVSWNYTDWGRITGYYQFRGNLTDFFVTTGRASGPGRPNSSASQYLKHQIFFAAEFEY